MGLALLSLALVLPATASAKAQGGCGRSVQGAGRHQHAGRADARPASRRSRRPAPAASTPSPRPRPPRSAREFTPANLDSYRAVVFLNTGMASPLTDAQRANFEAYFKKGGGFVGIGSAVETDPSWAFLTERPRHALVGPDRRRRPARSRSSTASMTRRKNLPEYWDRTDNSTTSSTNVRGVSHVLATVVEDPFEPAAGRATRSTASPAARWAPTTRSPSARTTRAAARSTPASATRRRASTRR